MRARRLLDRELDRGLQRDYGISKAEFSVLVTLWRASGREMRVGDLVDSLGWEKSRVSHQLTRMENRGFVAQTQAGPSGRRTRIGLTATGCRIVRTPFSGTPATSAVTSSTRSPPSRPRPSVHGASRSSTASSRPTARPPTPEPPAACPMVDHAMSSRSHGRGSNVRSDSRQRGGAWPESLGP